MYRLMLVEDEDAVREGISQTVNWETCGFELCAQAASAEEALERVEQQLPDVVMTDIIMPGMNGLELIERLQGTYPSIQYLIVSGHDEFTYAQKALRRQVLDFLLKPASSGTIEETLEHVRAQLDALAERSRDALRLGQMLGENRQLLQATLLTELLAGGLSPAEVAERSATAQLPENTAFFLMLLEVSETPQARSVESDPGLTRQAAFTVAREILGFYGDHCAVEIHRRLAVSLWRPRKDALLACEEIVNTLRRRMGLEVRVGVSARAGSLNQATEAYAQALMALQARHDAEGQRIFCFEELGASPSPRMPESVSWQPLESAITGGTAQEVSTAIAERLRALSRAAPQDVCASFLEAYGRLLRLGSRLGVDLSDALGTELGSGLFAFDFTRSAAFLEALGLRLHERIAKGQETVASALMERALAYIHAHYTEPELSLDSVCDALYISRSHFFAQFKKVCGTTFLRYLTDLRIDCAKELLRTTNRKTSQIAMDVGYGNPNYFSYCFKQRCGVSPVEYRRAGGAP